MQFPQGDMLVYIPAYYKNIECTKVAADSIERDVRPQSSLTIDVMILDPFDSQELKQYCIEHNYFYVPYQIPTVPFLHDWTINNMPYCLTRTQLVMAAAQNRMYKWNKQLDVYLKHGYNIGFARSVSYCKAANQPDVFFAPFSISEMSPERAFYGVYGDQIVHTIDMLELNGLNEPYGSLYFSVDTELTNRYRTASELGVIGKTIHVGGCLTFLGELWRRDRKVGAYLAAEPVTPKKMCPDCYSHCCKIWAINEAPPEPAPAADWLTCSVCEAPILQHPSRLAYIRSNIAKKTYKAPVVGRYGLDMSAMRDRCQQTESLEEAAAVYNSRWA